MPAGCSAPPGPRPPRSRRRRPSDVPGAELDMPRSARGSRGRFRGRGGADAARDGVPIVDRRPARCPRRVDGRTPGNRRGAPAPRRGCRRPDGARGSPAGARRGRARRLSHREPRRRRRSRTPPRPRRLHRNEAPVADVPARLHPAESPRHFKSRGSRARVRGPALLPDGRRQDGGVPRPRRVHHGPPAPPQTRATAAALGPGSASSCATPCGC